MPANWVMDVQSIVFTQIKARFSSTIKTKYGMTAKNFSTNGASQTDAVFPFVYVHLLPAVEQGRTLDGQDINGGLFTFQIDVTDNKTQARATAVAGEVLRIMKLLRFDGTSFLETEDTADTHRVTMRLRRMIGASDTL